MLRGHLQIILAALLWAMGGIIVRHIDLPTRITSFFRFVFAFLGLFVFLILTEKISFKFPKKKTLFLSSIATTLSTVLFFYSVKFTSVANAIILQYTAPIFVALFSPFILKEKLEKRTMVYLLFSFLGVIFIVSPEKILMGGNLILGVMFGLGSGIAFAFLILFGRFLRKDYSAVSLAMIQVIFSAIFLSPFLLTTEFQLDTGKILLLALLGIMTSSMPFALFLTGIKYVHAQHAAILSYFEPVAASIYAWILLSEMPTFGTFIGGIIIVLVGIIMLIRKE